MSAPPEVEVVVPLDGVDWLEDEIEAFADPEVEDEGRSRVYYVAGKSTGELAEFLRRMLAKHATTGGYAVEVKRGKVLLRRTTAEPWFVSSGALPTPIYERAVNDLARQVSEDPAWGAWWAKAPYDLLRFYLGAYGPAPFTIEPIRGDLWVAAVFPRMVDMGEHPSPQRAAEEAKTHVTAVLTKAAEWLGIPAPEGTASIGP